MSSPNGLFKFTMKSIKQRHAEAENHVLAQPAQTSRKRTMDKKLEDILVRQGEKKREEGKNAPIPVVYCIFLARVTSPGGVITREGVLLFHRSNSTLTPDIQCHVTNSAKRHGIIK